MDAAPNQLVVGRSACERAHDLLENYRGMLYNSNDVEITCTSIVGTSGIGGVYRYSFTASVRSVEAFTLPVNYVK